MKRPAVLWIVLIFAIFLSLAANSSKNDRSGNELLKNVVFLNQSNDQVGTIKMTLINNKGDETIKEMRVWGMGERFRLIKFLSPADIRGTAFLVQDADLDSEKMYIYLPELRRTRRIAGSAKGESFMDSDFSYSEMGSANYEEHYDAKRLKDEGENYVLELTRKKESDKEFDRLVMRVDKETMIPVKVEFYELKKTQKGEALELRKIMTSKDIIQVKDYDIPTTIVMEDVKRKHRTLLEFSDIEVDTGLSKDIFTERYMTR